MAIGLFFINFTKATCTLLRARNLVGKAKGKTSAKVTDVFVTIALGKEKFQTSTIKYGGKVQNSVEWFEECDLSIPDMQNDVELHVMNRGLLSDEFIGYVPVPLNQFGVYERPESRWLQLKHKPSKLPDGRYRGEIEVRLTFHVKSKNDIIQNPDLKKQRAPSLKSLVTAVGDKFKFTRSRSFRGDSRSNFSSPDTARSPRFQKKKHKSHQYIGDIAPTNNAVSFPAVDVYVPNWNENDYDNDSMGEGNFARSYSLTQDRRRRDQDFKSRSMFNLQSEHSFTFPRGGRGDRLSMDDSALRRPASRGSVVSQDGYLESMFRSEREVSERMNETYEDNIEEVSEDEPDAPQRKLSAQKYEGKIRNTGSSESLSSKSSESSKSNLSDSDKEIVLPKVKLKENARDLSEKDDINNEVFQTASDGDSVKRGNNQTDSGVKDVTSSESETDSESDDDSEHNSEMRTIIAREKERNNSGKPKFTISSQGSSDLNRTSSHGSSSSGYKGKSAAERAYERGSSDSFTNSRRKISPDADFNFTGVSQMTNGHSPTPQSRRIKKYARGGRRYTIQGLELPTYRSAPDIRSQRPYLSREHSVPEDLIAVYRNMNKEELIRLVVTHKAQIIRKDQYIKDLEKYIDDLLVRVMEVQPKLLQTL